MDPLFWKMKASLKLREDQAPLVRAKLPLKVAAIPLLSGITMGNSQDFALHIGTFFATGPSCKMAYKPNDGAGPFSLILKTGFGLWGSPNAAALAMTAEFKLSGKGGPFFSVHFRPRVGDFSIRKHALSLSSSQPENSVELAEAKHRALVDHGISSTGNMPEKLDKGTLFASPPNGDAQAPYHRAGSLSTASPVALLVEKTRSPASDSNLVIGSNFSFKIEGLDREKKRRPKGDGQREQQEVDGGNALGIADAGDDCLQEEGKRLRSVEEVIGRVTAPDWRFKGWSVNAHSSLPLGKRAVLNIRWGVKVPSELCQGWNCNISHFSMSQLPFLLIDKINIETIGPAKQKLRLNEMITPLEYEFLPYGMSEDNRDMLHMAGLCYSMNRQLQMLYSENKILRKAMEEMRAELEYRGSIGPWKPVRPTGEIQIQEENVPRPQLLDDSQKNNGKDVNYKDRDGRKDRKSGSRKELPSENNVVSSEQTFSMGGSQSEVAEELKKALMSRTNGPYGGREE